MRGERDLARRYAEALGPTPDVTSRAVARFRADPDVTAAWTPWRMLQVLAGVAGLLLAVLQVLAGTTHTGHDVAGLQAALAVGLLLAAWRPVRYGRPLTPVLLVAGVWLLLPAAMDTTAIEVDVLAEAAHLPIVVGAVALVLSRPTAPRARAQLG